MSVKRNVTVPLGSLGMRIPLERKLGHHPQQERPCSAVVGSPAVEIESQRFA
jgi:hypothetical protein